MSWEIKEGLSWNLDTSETLVWETKHSLSLLEKETWVNFFKKASDWIKKIFGGDRQSEENPDKSNENTPKQNEGNQNITEDKRLQEGFDKEKKTYTNPKSWLTYKCIDQVLDPAGNLKYPGGKKLLLVSDVY